MANIWVGTDYYVPEIDQSGDVINVSFASTTTSNTYNYIVSKNETPPNPESVGAATIVWLNGPFTSENGFYYGTSSDDSRRMNIAPSSTASANGTGLVTQIAIRANGHVNDIYADNFDQANVANSKCYHVVSGGTGWEELDDAEVNDVLEDVINSAEKIIRTQPKKKSKENRENIKEMVEELVLQNGNKKRNRS